MSPAGSPSKGPIGAALPGVNGPFPGLRSFETHEEPVFRGRRLHADELLRRLAEHRFLGIVGSSGSGKSSLVKAGLRPALERGYLAGASSRWRIAVMRPGMAPIDNLANALREAGLSAFDPAKLRSSSLGLIEAVREAGLAPGESLLVVADQFEELFRYQRRMEEIDAPSEASLFVSLLLTACARPDVPVYVVLTMRSDFLGDCARFLGLPEALSASQYLIPRLTRDQRRQAIEEPLRLFGASMTPQLIERLLNDSGLNEWGDSAGVAPDPLPVLQHALMRTWLKWTPPAPLDLSHYRDAGAMESALDQHAEQVFLGELDETGRKLAERIFRCLTTTELTRPVRRPTPLSDLCRIVGAKSAAERKTVDNVLAVFRDPRNSFIQLNRDGSVDISHESLIWKWKRLCAWVAEEAVSADLFGDLAKDASGEATWGEPKLSTTIARRDREGWNEAWADQYVKDRFEAVQSFVTRSRRAVRAQKRLRWLAIAAVVFVILFGAAAEYQRRQAAQKVKELEVSKQVSNSLAKELDSRKQSQSALESRISELKNNQGSTEEEKQRNAAEAARLQEQLNSSKSESAKLASQANNQSTDLLANIKALQTGLTAAQNQRDEAVKKNTQLGSTVASLNKQLEAARLPPVPAPKTDVFKESASAVVPAAKPRVATDAKLIRTLTMEVDNKLVASLAIRQADPIALVWGGYDVGFWIDAVDRQLVLGNGNYIAYSVAWSPDGKTIAAGCSDKMIRLWPAYGRSIPRTLRGHKESVEAVAWSPDSKTLASASTNDNTVRLWDAVTGKQLSAAPPGLSRPSSIRFSPDGKALAIGGSSRVSQWELGSGSLTTFPTHFLPGIVAFSPDIRKLATGDTLGDVDFHAMDRRDPLFLPPIKVHQKSVLCLAWSPDGRILASGSEDETIVLWDSATGKPLGPPLTGTSGSVTALAWSPDGTTLASGGRDKKIRIWSIPPAFANPR